MWSRSQYSLVTVGALQKLAPAHYTLQLSKLRAPGSTTLPSGDVPVVDIIDRSVAVKEAEIVTTNTIETSWRDATAVWQPRYCCASFLHHS